MSAGSAGACNSSALCPRSCSQRVRKGDLSTWAATRVLAPLARANTEHAAQLLSALAATSLSTRELQ